MMNPALTRASRPAGVIKHRIVRPDGSVTIRTATTDSRGITRRHDVTVVPTK